MQDFLARVRELGLVVLVRFILIAAAKQGVALCQTVATVAAETIMQAIKYGDAPVSLLSVLLRNRVEEFAVNLDVLDPDKAFEAAVRLELAVQPKMMEGLSPDEIETLVKVMTLRRLGEAYNLYSEGCKFFTLPIRGETKFFLSVDADTYDEMMLALVVTSFFSQAASTVSAVDFTEELVPRLINEEDSKKEESDEDPMDYEETLEFHGKYSDVFHERMSYYQNSKAYPLGCARVNPHFGDEAADREDEMGCLPYHFHGTINKKTKAVLIVIAREVALARKGFSKVVQATLKSKGRKFEVPGISVLEFQAAYLYVIRMYGYETQDPEMDLKSMQVMVNGSYKDACVNGDRMRSIHDADGRTVSTWASPEMRYWSSVRSKMTDMFKSTDPANIRGPFTLSKNGSYLVGSKVEVDELGFVWPALLISGTLAGFIISLGESKEEYLARKEAFSAACKKAKAYLSTDVFFEKLREGAPEKARIAWMFQEVTTKVAFVAIQGDMERHILELAGAKVIFNKPVTEEGYWTKPNSFSVFGLNGQLRKNALEATGSSEIIEGDDEQYEELEAVV